MEDNIIVQMYWQRNEDAIAETKNKYNNYLMKIANNILMNLEDSKESVNDTYLHTWNCIPPNRPKVLSTFLAKITRRISIDMYRKSHRQKRGGSSYEMSLTELEECIPNRDTPEKVIEERALAQSINRFLKGLSPQSRNTFISRYFYNDSIKDVAKLYNMSQSKVKSLLFRTRKELKIFLEKEDFSV